MVMSGKALQRNQKALASLMNETLNAATFEEHGRLRELFAQSRAGREQSITGSGHSLAMMAAASGMSPVASLSHRLGGLAGIKSLKAMDDTFDDETALAEACAKLAQIHDLIRNAPRQFMVVAEESARESLLNDLSAVFGDTPEAGQQASWSLPPVRETVRQLWTTSTEVNFAAKAYETVPQAHPDAPALAVLGPFLRNGFLHRAIRETGGAYGGGATQDADSASFRFYSYRDPRLAETLQDFDDSIDWLLSTQHEPLAVEEAILNVISSIDKPGSPAGRARSAFQSQLFGRTPEFRQTFRRNILSVTADDLKRVGDTYLKKDNASIAAITNPTTAESVASLGLDIFNV